MKNKNLLLIEDDVRLGSLIASFLHQHHFQVTHLTRGFNIYDLDDQIEFDLIVCDVMLPDIHGFKLFSLLQKHFHCPIIYLTACGKSDDHIKGLQLGARDYIVKPIDPNVLLARITSCLRQSGKTEQPKTTIKIKDLLLDKKLKSAYLGAKKLALTKFDFDLLYVLAEHHGEALNREFLFHATVGREYDGLDRTVDARTMRLRKKIADLNIPGLVIETIWGKGYAFSYRTMTA